MKKKYYVYQFLCSFMPIYPLYTLLFESKGFSIAQISLLFSIWTIPCIVLEIPSGVIADWWSRKNMLVLGSIFQALGFLCWLFSNEFEMYAIGFVFWGISGACCSGSKEALLYDTLKEHGSEAEFEKIYGRGEFISCMASVIACFLGGILAKWIGIEIALLISVLSAAISIFVACGFEEKKIFHGTKEKKRLFQEMGRDLKFFHHRNGILFVMILYLVIVGTCGVLDEYDQLIVSDLGFSFVFIGLWASIRKIFEGVGSFITPIVEQLLQKICHIHSKFGKIAVIGTVSALLLIGVAQIHKTWTIVFYAGYYFMIAICAIMTEDMLQQQIEEEGRSTIHSVVSLMMNLFGLLMYSILGDLFGSQGLFPGLQWVAIALLGFGFVGSILWMLCERKKRSCIQ